MSLENFKYNLKKLKECDQFWDEMKPIENGRLCLKCSKIIVDFSEMSFTEIALYLSASSKPICGYYLPEQINEINSSYPKFSLAIGLTTLLATSALAQPQVPVQNTIQTVSSTLGTNPVHFTEKSVYNDLKVDTFFLFGRVEYYDTATQSNQPVSFASIIVKGKNYGITTDKDGNFRLRWQTSDTAIAILITSVGYMTYELTDIPLSEKKHIDLGTIKLENWNGEMTEFRVSVKKRSKLERFWRKMTSPFRG